MSKTTVEWLQRLRKLFPEVPAELLERVLPDDQFDPELLPWNRHVRRRLKKADEIILHLFSGPDERTWKELETKDLLAKHVAAYILHLCLSGKVKMILAGPPCRTVSRLRHTQPGPPPLRTRFGATRFGRDNLSDQLRSMVADDTVLFLRSLTYYVVAEESAIERPKKGSAVDMWWKVHKTLSPTLLRRRMKRSVQASGHSLNGRPSLRLLG